MFVSRVQERKGRRGKKRRSLKGLTLNEFEFSCSLWVYWIGPAELPLCGELEKRVSVKDPMSLGSNSFSSTSQLCESGKITSLSETQFSHL